MKSRQYISTILVAMLLVSVFTFAVSASSYGPLGTLTLSTKGVYTRSTSIYDKKAYSDIEVYYVDVSAMTMITNPTVKIVDSENITWSDEVTLNGTGSYSGKLYDGISTGVTYYLAGKPSSWQVGSDTITARINVG